LYVITPQNQVVFPGFKKKVQPRCSSGFKPISA
jgi:hypothetical protein